MITGETGWEKVLQNLSIILAIEDKPFIKINCAAIPDNLGVRTLRVLEGAFTGADRKEK